MTISYRRIIGGQAAKLIRSKRPSCPCTRIYVRIRKGVLMCPRYIWISGESRVTRVTASGHTFARVYAPAYTHVRMRKAADVCVKIDYTAGENVINSSTNKGVRRLYNANSKNRGGLRGLRERGRTHGIREREVRGDRAV